MREIADYVGDVLDRVAADERTRARLAEDLTAHLEEAAARDGVRVALRRMGSVDEAAQALMDTMYDSKEDVIAELVRTRAALRDIGVYEYRSETTIWGLPLVHVHVSRGERGGSRVARGIIAIGDIAIGGVAIGGVAMGGMSIGGVSLGLLSLGGVSLGLLLAFGGLAVGYVAIGGCAVGVYAMGGAALAQRVAAGGAARAAIAIGDQASGATVLAGEMATAEAIRAAIRAQYPGTPGWLVRLFGMFR